MSANSDMKIKVGIFFGGPSREREISFAGGRTVYDNLNKSIFEPLPIFVDSYRNFILLDWAHIYKGSIRDFFPPVESLPESPNAFQIYQESLGELPDAELDQLLKQVGQRIEASELPHIINVAFLALHGIYGEDGQIQQQLADLKIPYTGSGVAASKLGMDKARQKEVMGEKGFPCPTVITLSKSEWLDRGDKNYFEAAKEQIGYPMVIRPANQGSSIGVSIIQESEGTRGFHRAMDQAFFRWRLPVMKWHGMSAEEKVTYVRDLTDIRHGLGFPLSLKYREHEATYYHPETLLAYLNNLPEGSDGVALLEAEQSEEKVIIEEFIDGKEFSCIVIRLEDGSSVALPPTEIIKGQELFDYRSKYMPGLSRKLTPIDLPDDQISAIRKECERLFEELDFQTYARIDGFITEENIFLNDPNTTSGMLPSSFFFHQAAEIGLNPSQFLTYIIRTSIQERIAEHQDKASYKALLAVVDEAIASLQNQQRDRKRIGVVLGGYSAERHISVESGRNIFEKLASSEAYEAIPIFLTGTPEQYEFYQLPINLLLKDNADDIRDKIKTWKTHPIIEDIKQTCQVVTDKYASAEVVFAPQRLTLDQLAKKVDGVFIALHGRPGEDGQLQLQLDAKGVPYNGSGVKSSSLTINKYKTLQTLKENGFKVAGQLLLGKAIYESDPNSFYQEVEATFSYPFVAKPVDDGCSAAVKVLKGREQLAAFTRLIFRPVGADDVSAREVLELQPQEEFPAKENILFEQLITREEGVHFLEITGGLLTRYDAEGELTYEVFEPSETLSSGAVLSLEEKFLAGEGQNITPARFASIAANYESVATQVKTDLEKAAKVLNVQGYARIDAFVRVLADGTAETQIIEVNSLPGMTPATCIFHQAAIAGYKPYEFIDRILTFGFEKKNKILSPPVVPVTEEAPLMVEEAIAEPEIGAHEEQTTSSTITDESGTSYISYVDPSETAAREQASSSVEVDETLLDRLKRTIVAPVWEFLKAPIFLKNLAAILGFVLLLFIVMTSWLKMYTDHNESIQVDDYIGLTVEEAVRKAKSRSFKVVVDSLYVAGNKPNVIYSQTPEAYARVKENRTIFMVRTTAKGVPIPFKPTTDDFQGAKSYLESRSIIVNEPKTIFNARRAEGTIVEATYNGQTFPMSKLRNDGIEIYQGESIDFVVYTRVSDYVGLPNLVCRTFSEAEFLIQSRFLKMGVIHGNKEGSAYVYKQEPAYVPNQSIRKGTTISLFLTSGEPDDCE